LREHFKECGEIKNVRVIKDKLSHDGKGFGYIFFKSLSGYKKALELNKSELLGREIRVKKAVPAERL
jgi:RNA recognition motif-containing protein